MKKFIITAIALFFAMFTMNAQDPSNLSKAARLVYDWAEQNGYEPKMSLGDFFFEVGETSLYVTNSEDETFIQVWAPVDALDLQNSTEVIGGLLGCNLVNRDYPLVKAFLTDEGVVYVAVETCVDETPQIGEYMEYAVQSLLNGIDSLSEVIAAYR